MEVKKLFKALLYPHIAVLILLIPISGAALAAAVLLFGSESAPAIISYVLAAYTLTVWCFKIPRLVSAAKAFSNENKYAVRWRSDVRLRMKISLYTSFFGNIAFALFNICLGIFHRTFWFFSIGIYYICLALMRHFLLGYTKRYSPREKMRIELSRYRACGWIMLVINLALSLIVFFMIYWGRTFRHHMITAIAMAAYTFFAFTMAIINVSRYRKYKSPIFSASKAINLVAACVSMMTLEVTMLTVFDDGTMDALAKKLMLALTGAAVSAVILTVAVYMIINGTKKLRTENINERQ